MKRFNLKKLSDLQVRKLYQIEISNRFAALGNLNDREDINRVWGNMISRLWLKTVLSLYELQQHKPQFDEKYLRFLDQRKQAKMQWVQDPNQSNIDNLNNGRREASRHCRNKKKEYVKATTDELETNS